VSAPVRKGPSDSAPCSPSGDATAAPAKLIGARVVFAAALAIALLGCEGGRPAATELALEDLVDAARRYDGERVTTRGVVSSHPDRDHYWIQEGERYRVGVRPRSAVSSRLGERVRVTGRFTYSGDEGRWLRAEQIESAER